MEPSSLLDLFQPEWSNDPYALYRVLRDRGPVLWDDYMRTWVVLSHEHVAALSKHEQLSGARIDEFHRQLPAESQGRMAPLAKALADMMLFNEPPRHTRLRKLIRPGLTPRLIRSMREEILAVTTDLLDRAGSALDVIGDLSEPLSRTVIARIAGVGPDAVHLLEDWQGLLHEFFTQSSAQTRRIQELREAFDENSRRRRAGTSDDLFSEIISDQLQRDSFTDDEVFANFLLLIDAGQATTTHMIGNAVLALLRDPAQLALLRADPSLTRNAVDELIRYDSSVQFTTRMALDDFTVAGQRISRGDSVTLVLGAGNRDPLRYPDPDRLDVTRKASDHLSFGHGVHYCLGASLAVAEMEIALSELITRYPRLELVNDDPDWMDSINFRFLKTLPVTCG
ncbi:cytochrome P450 [Saccharothrix coeruleofusca]|uniref:Biotin biosynthesis cytochrome P450 n=1 Tax=Saccharothrix coeruleofusca TaxID=33919 RepID=A0A918EGL7_9PSEU|nr:cytochrome P450 [Saccharothrix coeruleofusca]GGP74207.1 biotin biosynthesis cytochrome P450 [Saccharothrix coeruleofusca]